MILNAATRLLAADRIIIVTLPEKPPASLGKGDLKKVPYARIAPDFVWDKGTEDAKVFPNLEWIWVPPKLRDQGYGSKLVQAILKAMKAHKIREVMFDDYADGFWQSQARRFKEIKIKGRIGKITLGRR